MASSPGHGVVAAAAVPPPPPNSSTLKFGKILLDISNSVLPRDKLVASPSGKDGLSEEQETLLRSLGCDLIQIAGRLLKLPQVAMATGCVLFHRFYYAKSFVRLPFDETAMACVGLACKIEESPRRTRDIINVFKHIKQVRSGRTIAPMVLDHNYIDLKNRVIKAERRILKELGFCVHVKHPHKIIVMYLRWLEESENKELTQMSWNFMNDSLRTDVFVRYPPETIAVACIYLSARKLKIPMPKSPHWFEVLGVEEDDIKDCCYRMICLYNQEKPNQEELEKIVENLRKKMDETRRAARDKTAAAAASGTETPGGTTANSPTSHSASPAVGGANAGQIDSRGQDPALQPRNGDENYRNGSPRSRSRSPSRHHSNGKRKSGKHRRRSRSGSYDRSRDGGGRKKSRKRKSGSITPEFDEFASRTKSHKKGHHKEKIRYRSRSRSRDRYPGEYRDRSSNGTSRSSYADGRGYGKGGKREDYYRR